MGRFIVAWEVEISAASPLLAAKRARALQTDPRSTCNTFTVEDVFNCETHSIDLDDQDNDG